MRVVFGEGIVHRKWRRDDFPTVWAQKRERRAISREGSLWTSLVRGLSTGNGEERIFQTCGLEKRGDEG